MQISVKTLTSILLAANSLVRERRRSRNGSTQVIPGLDKMKSEMTKKFPAFSTAFIVAVDTTLVFKPTEYNLTEIMYVLKTNSSLQANVGCFGIGSSINTEWVLMLCVVSIV